MSARVSNVKKADILVRTDELALIVVSTLQIIRQPLIMRRWLTQFSLRDYGDDRAEGHPMQSRDVQ